MIQLVDFSKESPYFPAWKLCKVQNITHIGSLIRKKYRRKWYTIFCYTTYEHEHTDITIKRFVEQCYTTLISYRIQPYATDSFDKICTPLDELQIEEKDRLRAINSISSIGFIAPPSSKYRG